MRCVKCNSNASLVQVGAPHSDAMGEVHPQRLQEWPVSRLALLPGISRSHLIHAHVISALKKIYSMKLTLLESAPNWRRAGGDFSRFCKECSFVLFISLHNPPAWEAAPMKGKGGDGT